MIEIRDISKIYKKGRNEVAANRDISFTVPERSICTIVGKSGSGKSTLLNLLGGLDTPTSGKIIFNGQDISHFNNRQLASHRLHTVGIVFQSFNLVYSKTALENVMLPLVFAGETGARKKDLATVALQRVGLGDRLQHKANELSGGEAQRVAIARALVNDPAVILADEPTGNLDSVTTEEILDILRGLKNNGKTIVMITHDNDIAQSISDKIITLKDGRILNETA